MTELKKSDSFQSCFANDSDILEKNIQETTIFFELTNMRNANATQAINSKSELKGTVFL